MDQFVVSARKYRPATFNTVVGQSSITTTLKNAIRNNHLAQAFLFCGPRGVGKTTCARILAKTINCTNLTPDTEGCNECESCVSFNNGQSLNIFELDAASNNSVDNMRDLVDQVRYAPQSGKYKVYIIDEVHMLTMQAFNAFLKTLEEPPPYAIFILATTEKHKIIPTILSRCQIFDFNRITVDDIAGHLAFVASSEGVTAEEEALQLIALKADGALRDALSIFDQIVNFAGNNITYRNVIENLNILDYEYYFRLTDLLSAGKFPDALLVLNELITDGFDVHHFITGLSGHFRDLLVCKDPQTVQLLETSEKNRAKYLAQAQQCPASLLFSFLEISNRCDIEFKSSQNQRLHTELALLKMCSLSGNAFTNETNITSGQVAKPPVAETAIPVKEKKNPDQEIKAATAQTAPAAAPVSSPVTPVPATTQSVPVTRTRTSTISISKKLNSDKETKPDPEVSKPGSAPGNPFTIEDVIAAVGAFVEKIRIEGRRQLSATLSKHDPVILENSVIEFPVDNSIQFDDIKTNQSELLGFIKNRLNNHLITIRPRVVEEDKLKETPYTPAEKFNKMAEKNPGLTQLRQQFDLDLDS